MSIGKRQDQAFAGDDLATEPVVVEGKVEEGDVQPLVAQLLHELVGLQLVKRQLDVGVPARELAEHRREHDVRGGGRETEDYPPDFSPSGAAYEVLRLLDLVEDAVRFAQQQSSRLGQLDAASQPLE